MPMLFFTALFSWLSKNMAVSSGILIFALITMITTKSLKIGWFGFLHLAFLLWIGSFLISLLNGKKKQYTKFFIASVDKFFLLYLIFDIIINLLKGQIIYEQIYFNLTLFTTYLCISASFVSKKDILIIISFGVFAVFVNCFSLLFRVFTINDFSSLQYLAWILIDSANGFAAVHAVWIGLVMYKLTTASSKVAISIYLLGLILVVCAVFIAASRTATFCMLMLLIAYLFHYRSSMKWQTAVKGSIIVLIVPVMFVLILIMSNKIDYVLVPLEKFQGSADERRDDVVIDVIKMSVEHLLLGSDIGYITKVDLGETAQYTYDKEIDGIRPRNSDDYIQHTHCWYTQVLLDTGLFGLGFLLFFIYSCFKPNLKSAGIGKSKNDTLVLCLRHAMIGILFIGIFQNVRLILSLILFFAIFARMANSLIRFEHDGRVYQRKLSQDSSMSETIFNVHVKDGDIIKSCV